MNRRTRRRSSRQMGRGRTKRKSPKKKPRKKAKKKVKRKGPEISATECKVGEVREGNDGNKWKVQKVKNGVKRWMPIYS